MKKGRKSGDKEGDGQALWDYVTRSIKAYDSSKRKAAPKADIRKPASQAATNALPQPAVPPRFIQAAPAVPKGFDRSTESKLRRGQLPLEGCLDLHGLTQAEAYAALHRFMAAAVAHEKRTVLIITGKGRRFEGVLRKAVPQWLKEPTFAKHIVALTPAHQKDGGSGAFYLRLRKPK